MRRCWVFVFMVVTCGSALAAVEERIRVRDDGSVVGRFQTLGGAPVAMRFNFGLPRIAAAREWRESDTLRRLWLTNGIRYTQTILVCAPALDDAAAKGDAGSNRVLLVNIEGENTNTEYAEAFAELAVEIQEKRQELELKGGLIWRLDGEARLLVGALDIPESGIKVARGEALRFSGNMPPSLKGSMTVKIPFAALAGEAAAEWLQAVDFEQELRRATRSPREAPMGEQPR